jgi:hypothetical protein
VSDANTEAAACAPDCGLNSCSAETGELRRREAGSDGPLVRQVHQVTLEKLLDHLIQKTQLHSHDNRVRLAAPSAGIREKGRDHPAHRVNRQFPAQLL